MVKLNPDLRDENDPELGELIPIETNIFFDLKVEKSNLGELVGKGVFAGEDIPENSIICIGGGQLTSILTKVPKDKDYLCVYDEKLFMGPLDYDNMTPNWFMNHSCDSNVKVIGRLILVSRKDISKGEELFVDYRTLVAGDFEWEMECKCGSENCNKRLSNNDWENEDIFKKYYSEWPSFIQRRGVQRYS